VNGQDERSVGELLRDADVTTRQLLMDATGQDAPAMLRTWGEVVQLTWRRPRCGRPCSTRVYVARAGTSWGHHAERCRRRPGHGFEAHASVDRLGGQSDGVGADVEGVHGAFCRSALCGLLARINTYLVRWVCKKYQRFRAQRKARAAWERVTTQYPRFFAHWAWVRYPLMIKMTRAE